MTYDASPEMVAFLGGDGMALRIANALCRHGCIETPEQLREARAEMQQLFKDDGKGGWYRYEEPLLLDVKHIGWRSIVRIDRALEGDL